MSRGSGITIGGKELDSVSLRKSILILLIGFGAASFGLYDYAQQSEAIENAVEVDATVVETGVESVSSRRGSPDYRPDATFEYSYQGETYTGNDVFPSMTTKNYDTRSEARSVLQDYQEGDTVTAHVNPDSPSSAFLENERSNDPLLFTVIGGGFVLVGGWSAFKSLAGP